jgi:hypothetical protein
MTPTIISIIAAILGTTGFIISLICVAIIAGFTRSTHTVQYVEAPKPMDIPDPFLDEKVEELEEREILAKVGKKKVETPDPVSSILDEEMENITKSDSLF